MKLLPPDFFLPGFAACFDFAITPTQLHDDKSTENQEPEHARDIRGKLLTQSVGLLPGGFGIGLDSVNFGIEPRVAALGQLKAPFVPFLVFPVVQNANEII
jgi:hypothetical protein